MSSWFYRALCTQPGRRPNAAVLKNLFRKTYGMSMRDYRKSHRSAEEQ